MKKNNDEYIKNIIETQEPETSKEKLIQANYRTLNNNSFYFQIKKAKSSNSGVIKILYPNSEQKKYIKIHADILCQQSSKTENEVFCNLKPKEEEEEEPYVDHKSIILDLEEHMFCICSICHESFESCNVPEKHLKIHKNDKLKKCSIDNWNKMRLDASNSDSSDITSTAQFMQTSTSQLHKSNCKKHTQVGCNYTIEDLILNYNMNQSNENKNTKDISENCLDKFGMFKNVGWNKVYTCNSCSYTAPFKSSIIEHTNNIHGVKQRNILLEEYSSQKEQKEMKIQKTLQQRHAFILNTFNNTITNRIHRNVSRKFIKPLKNTPLITFDAGKNNNIRASVT